MKTERRAVRIGGLEREAIGDGRRREADAVALFQQRPIAAADDFVFGFELFDGRILQGFEQPARTQRKTAVADVQAVLMRPPARADVVVIAKRFEPRRRVHHVAVPLDQQQMRGMHVLQQFAHHEARIGGARSQRRDRDGTAATVGYETVGNEDRVFEFDGLLRQARGARGQFMRLAIDDAQRDAGQAQPAGRRMGSGRGGARTDRKTLATHD